MGRVYRRVGIKYSAVDDSVVVVIVCKNCCINYCTNYCYFLQTTTTTTESSTAEYSTDPSIDPTDYEEDDFTLTNVFATPTTSTFLNLPKSVSGTTLGKSKKVLVVGVANTLVRVKSSSS